MVILGELERHSVPHVHAIAAGPATSVKEEGLSLLVPIKDLSQFTVAEHNASAHESVWAMASDLLEALEDIRGERGGPEFSHKLVIIHGQEFAGLIDTTRDIERSDNLPNGLGLGRGFLGEAQLGERWGLSWFVRHGMRIHKG